MKTLFFLYMILSNGDWRFHGVVNVIIDVIKVPIEALRLYWFPNYWLPLSTDRHRYFQHGAERMGAGYARRRDFRL
jgi:hypothetical protein